MQKLFIWALHGRSLVRPKSKETTMGRMVWSVKHSGDGAARLRPTSESKRREYFTRETCTSKSLPIRTQEKLAQSEELRGPGRATTAAPNPARIGDGRRRRHVGNYARTPANFDPKWVTGPHTQYGHIPWKVGISGAVDRPLLAVSWAHRGGVHSPSCMTAEARCTRCTR